MSKKHTLFILVLILIIGGVLWGVLNKDQERTPEPEVITSDIDTSDWLTYRNDELGFEFKYPKEFHFVNRLEMKEGAILISDKEITFNEFLGGYFAPITIRPFSEKEDNEYVSLVLNKKEQVVNVDGSIVSKISGTFPEQPPYREFQVALALFDNEEVIVEVREVRTFAGDTVGFDIEQFLDTFLTTLRFND